MEVKEENGKFYIFNERGKKISRAFEHEDDADSTLMDWLAEDEERNGIAFADPGGRSALRAATPENPRNQPCPTCGHKNRLTPEDVRLGYQCDSCADALESGRDWE